MGTRREQASGGQILGKLDPGAIAVSGWSCGGVQALTIGSRNPRVRMIVIHNSGIFPAGAPRQPEMELGKEALLRIRVPTIYILGGPNDVAHANGSDDYARLKGVFAAKVSLPVGHQGTFFKPNGGRAAIIATAWLDWRLKRDPNGQTIFLGLNCTLCSDRLISYNFKTR